MRPTRRRPSRPSPRPITETHDRLFLDPFPGQLGTNRDVPKLRNALPVLGFRKWGASIDGKFPDAPEVSGGIAAVLTGWLARRLSVPTVGTSNHVRATQRANLVITGRVNASRVMNLHIRTFARRCHLWGSNSNP